MYRKELLGETEDWLAKYISSIDEDREIAREVILTLIEHVLEVYRCGIIDRDVLCKIFRELKKLYNNIEDLYNNPEIYKYEDIHEFIEKYLIDRLGPECGGWIGIGRSRNDHVATAHRLRLRKYVYELLNNILKLREVILKRSIEYERCRFIAFTHGQPAQITLFSHYLLSVDEMLENFTNLIIYVLENFIEKCPLGSGPAVGTLTPIDRSREASDLNMGIIYNCLYATESRDYFTIMSSILTCLAVELSRFINDLIRFSDMNIIYIPDEHCATSSIMPHKRNPATLEIARARISIIIGNLVSILNIIKNVGKGYYLDLQEVTPHVWNIFKDVNDCLKILTDIVDRLKVNEDTINDIINKTYLTSAETVEYESINTKKSFRIVYMNIAKSIREKNVKLLDPESVLKMRKSLGSSSYEQVRFLIQRSRESIEKQREVLNSIKDRIDKTIEKIFNECESICLKS